MSFYRITGDCEVDVIIQARFGSSRLPGKVLLPLGSRTILQVVYNRVKSSDRVGNVIVATSDQSKDDIIEKEVGSWGGLCFRGSEDNVLERFYTCASHYNMKHIARVTADCPFIDPDIISRVVDMYFDSGCDYCSNCRIESFPDGLDVEVFGMDALSSAYKKAKKKSETEHVTPYIRTNKDVFKITDFVNDVDLSYYRWTLDQEEDYVFLKQVFDKLNNIETFRMVDILRVVKNNPELVNINAGIMRNEGYLKSLQEETHNE